MTTGSEAIPPDASVPEDEPQVMRMVEVIGVSLDLPGSHPVLSLREMEGAHRELHFAIGFAEGVALASAWRQVPSRRPLTHEMFTAILERFDVSVAAVRIVAVESGVFYAELVMSGRQGKEVVPCRPTDGITLALRERLPVPILVAEEVLILAGTPAPLPVDPLGEAHR